jgi:hypothetical protein
MEALAFLFSIFLNFVSLLHKALGSGPKEGGNDESEAVDKWTLTKSVPTPWINYGAEIVASEDSTYLTLDFTSHTSIQSRMDGILTRWIPI